MSDLAKRSRSNSISTPSKRTRAMSSSRKSYTKKKAIPTRVSLGKQPFPKQLANTLRYCEKISISNTLGAINSYQFSCNGCYDPNVTGTGHQPLYFDQLCAVYDHYTVVKSKMTCRVVCLAQAVSAYFVAYIDDDTNTNVATWDGAAERETAKTVTFSPGPDGSHVITLYWDAKKVFAGDPLADPDLQGTASANPVEQSYFTLISGNSSTENQGFDCYVTIDYDVVWNEFKSIAQS